MATLPPPRLAYVYSVPLVHRAGNESTEPDMLDAAQELQSLRKTLKEAGRKLVFRAEVATVRNFRFLVTLGCRMLHYTGHGNPTCLIFENDRGEANLLNVEALTELFRAGGVRTQLVFVSACHSESAGNSFAEAGVPHVVAVKYDEKVTDYAARVFAEQFYLSLVTGNTVRNAFQVRYSALWLSNRIQALHARSSCLYSMGLAKRLDERISTNNNNPSIVSIEVGIMSIMAESAAAQDTKKFLLLPEDGNHDVAIFSDAQLGEFMDETPRDIKNTAHKPPVFFLGRNAKVQERYRCVTIRGPPGIGKTAVAFRACEYMAERRMFDAIYYVPMHEALFPVTDKEALCEAIGTALEKGGARDGRDIVRALQEGDVNRRVLLLLDGIDRFLAPGSVLITLLSFLLSKHPGLFLVITSEHTLNKGGDGLLENTPEKVVELAELSDLNSAHLLVYVAPRRLRFEEMTTRPFGAKGEALAQLAASPVLKELHGHPKAIIMFAPLLEGNRLENLLEAAKKCYHEATHGRDREGGEGGDEGGAGGLTFKDRVCERIWRGLTAPGKRSSHSSLIGVPWYSVANALQQQLKEALLVAASMGRGSSTRLTGSPPAAPDPGAPPPPPSGTPGQAVYPDSDGALDNIRGLSDTDIEFLKTKLVSQPNSDLVRGKDFEAFCEWWVPVLQSLRRLAREWLCVSPPLLHGFAGRAEAEAMLRGKEEGTFLVRFSTSHLGLLAISFVAAPAGVVQHCLVQATSEGCDLFMSPARKRYACLEDLLRDCSNLSILYPGVPKLQALQQLGRR